MPEARGRSKETEFVGRLVKDPRHPPDTILLQGFVGASAEAGHTRLYSDAQLTSWVDIPNEAVLHTEEISKDQSPLGGSYVWIDRSAQVVPGRAERARVEARYLEGAVVQENLAATQPGFAGAGVPSPITAPPICAAPSVVLPACPTNSVICQPSPSVVRPCPTMIDGCGHPSLPIICQASVVIPCPTQQVTCPTRPAVCHPSLPIICQPSVVIQCPTHQVTCPTQPAICGHPSAVIICQPSVLIQCVTQPVHCAPSVAIPCQSIPACPSVAGCPSIACVPGGGVGQGPVM
jgi:hypothetical protein